MIDISQLIGNTANAALKTLTQSNAASTAAADAKAFQDALSRAR
jgi:flagellar hook-length control protein FliK